MFFFIFGRFSIAGKLPKWPKIPFQYPLALRHPKILEKCRKHHRILVSVRNRFWAPPPPAKADIATAILTNVIEHLVLLFCPPISTPSPPKRCGRISERYFWEVFLRLVSERYFWEVFLRGISERYFWDLFLRGICERSFWEVFLRGISEGICERYFFEVFLRGISERYLWEVFVRGISESCESFFWELWELFSEAASKSCFWALFLRVSEKFRVPRAACFGRDLSRKTAVAHATMLVGAIDQPSRSKRLWRINFSNWDNFAKWWTRMAWLGL